MVRGTGSAIITRWIMAEVTQEQVDWIAAKMKADDAAQVYKDTMAVYVGERVDAEHVMDAAIEQAKADYAAALEVIDAKHKDVADVARTAMVEARVAVEVSP
jgi:trans-2-enoyl-CoA reductase